MTPSEIVAAIFGLSIVSLWGLQLRNINKVGAKVDDYRNQIVLLKEELNDKISTILIKQTEQDGNMKLLEQALDHDKGLSQSLEAQITSLGETVSSLRVVVNTLVTNCPMCKNPTSGDLGEGT